MCGSDNTDLGESTQPDFTGSTLFGMLCGKSSQPSKNTVTSSSRLYTYLSSYHRPTAQCIYKSRYAGADGEKGRASDAELTRLLTGTPSLPGMPALIQTTHGSSSAVRLKHPESQFVFHLPRTQPTTGKMAGHTRASSTAITVRQQLEYNGGQTEIHHVQDFSNVTGVIVPAADGDLSLHRGRPITGQQAASLQQAAPLHKSQRLRDGAAMLVPSRKDKPYMASSPSGPSSRMEHERCMEQTCCSITIPRPSAAAAAAFLRICNCPQIVGALAALDVKFRLPAIDPSHPSSRERLPSIRQTVLGIWVILRNAAVLETECSVSLVLTAVSCRLRPSVACSIRINKWLGRCLVCVPICLRLDESADICIISAPDSDILQHPQLRRLTDIGLHASAALDSGELWQLQAPERCMCPA